MKKFLTLLLSLMLSLSCIGLIACGGEEEGTGEGAGNTPSGSQVTYTVTEAQFNSAFDIYGAPFQVTATEGEGADIYTAVVNYVPGKIYEKETDSDGISETYYSKEGDKYFKYVKEDGEWLKLDADSYVNVLEFYNPLVFVADELELNLSFSDLTYNKDAKSYDYVKDYGVGISLNLTFKFENARIIYFGVRLGNDVEAEVLTMSFAYNNVPVSLPQIGGESGGETGGESGGETGGETGGDSSCQHVWQEVSLNNGIMTYSCPNCKASKTENKTQLYKNVTANIADTVFALADGASSSASGYSVSLFSDYTWQDADWSVHGMNVKGVVMFVKMLSQMMDNPDFNITSAPVIFSYSYPALGETGVATLLYDFDVENDKVTMYWDVNSTSNGITRNIYMYIDVTYDFDTNTLVGFNLSSNQQGNGQSMTFGYSYYDNNLRFTVDSSYLEEVNLTRAELNAVKDTAIALKADFSKEYSDMMDSMNPSQGGGESGGENPNPNPNPGETPKPPIPEEPKPEKPELSQEWLSLFKLENVSIRLTSVALINGQQHNSNLGYLWYIDGNTWYAQQDLSVVDGVVTDYVEAWFNGQESYVLYSYVENGVTTQNGGYTEYQEISIFYDINLIYILNQFKVCEHKFSSSQNGNITTYTLSEICYGDNVAYQDISIVVQNGEIRSITYTLPNGYQFEGQTYPVVSTISFYNYGATAPMFPTVSEGQLPGTGDNPGVGGDENSQYTVTESQFNDAINQANYTQFMVDGVNTLKVNGVIEPNQSNTIKYVIVADGSYTAVSGQEIYMQKVGSEYFGYQKVDGVWQKMSINQNTYDSNRQRILSNASPAAYINMFGLTYDMLTFNDTENCYVYSPKGEEGISATIKVFFENDKIMKVEMVTINTELQEEISSIMNYTYSNVAITYPSVEGGNQGETPEPPIPEEPKPEKPELSQEWLALFKLENLSVRQNSVALVNGNQQASALVTLWYIDGNAWYTKHDTRAVDGVVTDYVEAWFNGQDAYIINAYDVDGVTNKAGGYVTYQDISVYYDTALLFLINEFKSYESGFTSSQNGSIITYVLPEIRYGETLAYQNVTITVQNKQIKTISYTLPNGFKTGSGTYPMVNTLTFYNYGATAPMFPLVSENPNPNPGETPEPPIPEEPKPEDPEQQEAYVFKFKSIVIMGKECFVGDTIYNLTITEDFATLVLNYDYSAHMVTSDMTSKGTWQVFGDVIMVELTDDVDTYKFILDYDEVSNVVTFKVENYTYKFDMPNGVSYGDIVGEVDMSYANLGKIVVGENEFNVGDTVNERVLEADSAYLKIFVDGKFMFHTVAGHKLYGYWTLNKIDQTILISFEFDEEEYTSTVTTYNNGAVIIVDLSEFDGLTYHLNIDDIGGGDAELDSIYGKYMLEMMKVNVAGQIIEMRPGQSMGSTQITPDYIYIELFDNGTYVLSGTQFDGGVNTGNFSYIDGDIIFDIESALGLSIYFEDGRLVMIADSVDSSVTYYLTTEEIEVGGGDAFRFTVTEEEFNKVLELKKVDHTIQNSVYTYSEDYSEQSNTIILIKGDNVLCVQALEDGICWIYYVKTGEDYVIYNSLDFVEWFAIPVNSEQANAMYTQLMLSCTPYGAIEYFDLSFADFSYVEDEQLYVFSNEQITISLGFINGAFVYVNAQVGNGTNGQEYNSYLMDRYKDVVFPEVNDGVPQGGSTGSLGQDIEDGLFDDMGGNGGTVSPENPNSANVFHVQSITINEKTYYVGDMVDEEFILERDFAIFKIYDSIDSFYMLVDGVEYKGTFENLELGVNRLHFENQFGETGTIDVYTDKEEYKFTLTIQDMVIVFEYSHFEGGNTGEENWKEPATYMEGFATKSVTYNGITYYVGDQLPSGRMVDEYFATFEYFDNYTFWLNVDGYTYSGDLEYNSSSSANLIFINENGQKETLVCLFISEDPYEISITVKGYEIIFQFAYDQELGGGEPPYDEDAQWGKTFLVSSVNYEGQDYNVGSTLPNGDMLNEEWAVFELYGNYRFYLTIYGVDYIHIEGNWSEYSDTQIKLSYIDMDGDECSIYVDVNNDGTCAISIKAYYITFKLAYGSGDDNQGDDEQKYEWKKIYTVSSVNYEGGIYYENSTLPNGEYIDAKWIVVTVYSNHDVEISFNGYGYVGEWKNIDEYTSQIYYFDSEGNSQTLTVDVNNEDGLYTFTLEGYEITVKLEYEENNEDFDQENNGEENLEDTIPPVSTEEDKTISGDRVSSGLMQ